MITRITTAAVLLVAALSTPAMAQFKVHSDGRGYTYRSARGNSTFSYRYDTGATYNRIGNFATYHDKTGTTGSSVYSRLGRYDSYRNNRQSWSGSGYTPYDAPELTTYRRTSSERSSGLIGLGAVGTAGAGVYGLRRWAHCLK